MALGLMMFDRKHPYLVFALGIYLCGVKFPFNWLAGKDVNRKRLMEENSFGLLWEGNRELAKAWANLDKEGKTLHDATDIVVEWANVPEWQSYAVKFLCSLFVYSTKAFIIIIGGLIYVCSS